MVLSPLVTFLTVEVSIIGLKSWSKRYGISWISSMRSSFPTSIPFSSLVPSAINADIEEVVVEGVKMRSMRWAASAVSNCSLYVFMYVFVFKYVCVLYV